MNKFLQAFTAFLIWSSIALLFHYFISDYLFGNCAIAHSQQIVTAKETDNILDINSDLFLITDDKGTKIFEFEEPLIIKSKTDSVYIPISFNQLKDSIKLYLEKKQSTNLIIVVNYLKLEINNSTGENLGQKRGDFLKKWFVNAGILPHRITIETQLAEFNFDELQQYKSAISFYFKDLANLKTSNSSGIVTKKILRFSFGNQSFRPSEELIDYVLELKSFLSQYPNKKIYIIGHTDSEGDATFNYNIGLKRAQFVKDFLISQEIESYKIISESKGEMDPIADNTTREGKSLNRRIEIIIK